MLRKKEIAIDSFLNVLYSDIEDKVRSAWYTSDENFLDDKIEEEFRELARYLVKMYEDRWIEK